MKRIEKGGRSLPTPRLFELIDIILCINNLLTLLLLTIVKPYLSTNKQLHYIRVEESIIVYRQSVIPSIKNKHRNRYGIVVGAPGC